MSVKFEKDTIKQTGGGGVAAGTHGAPTMKSGKHELADEIGTALTGGKGNIGTKGYLAAYLQQLQTNPLRTKMLTSGTLSGLQELLASWIAKDRNKNGNYFTARVPKMAAYGAFISAPLGHVLISILQKLFQGRTSLKMKILQILVSNLVIAPIQNSVYLVSMAIIAGAKTIHQVHATWKAGFMPVMKVSWISSPLALAFAQKFLPEHTWVPFFNIIGFVIGTYVNSVTKKKRLAALRKRYNDERGGRPDDYPSGPKY
ncbi:PXMP2/4 family protein 3 [Lachnellula arida]|uniref:PXMP2/4 family protein 3 n=1 Tax=Lachnellula arida TaxID=1316785 RepID=A0A8T9BAZ0_9HELO|nr:PXMP2/4 family protein 3 [Lachnellula arida]